MIAPDAADRKGVHGRTGEPASLHIGHMSIRGEIELRMQLDVLDHYRLRRQSAPGVAPAAYVSV
jgi:hypothetical protein